MNKTLRQRNSGILRPMILGCIGAVLAIIAPIASANNIFDWSFTDGGTNSGSGTFLTSSVGNPFAVLGVTGVVDGFTITGLSTYAGADNLFYDPGTANPGFVDFGGISFTTNGGADYTYNIGGSYVVGQYVLNVSGINPIGYPGVPGSYVLAALDPERVPEPGTLALIGLGLVGIGLMARRKAR